MNRIYALLALSLLAAIPAGAQAKAPKPSLAAGARASANLASLFSDRDYPAAALRAGEKGAVAFSLYIGPDGVPTACSVTASSGSAVLDSTTCRLLMERARFQPARDSKGQPTTDSFAGRIVWNLPEGGEDEDLADLPPGLLLWSICVGGEAAKLVPGDLPPAEVVTRAFGPCTALEARVERGLPPSLPTSRADLARMIEDNIVKIRAALRPSVVAPKAP